jgi:glycosyltransferase involved in cell wall biosynthesis
MNSIDVVVPCYRYGRYLEQCVSSVLMQSGCSTRVLIIDDASPDNTHEVAEDLARRDKRVIFSRHGFNKGHIATYNEGLEWCSAKYLLLLSADDFLLPGALGRSVALMERKPSIGFVFGKCLEQFSDEYQCPLDTPAHFKKRGTQVMSGTEFMTLSGPRNIVPTPTAVVRTELQHHVGGYCVDLPHSGDMEMWFRLAAHGDVGIVDAYQAVYRRHTENMSLNYANSQSLLLDFVQRREALHVFFHQYSSRLPDARGFHQRMIQSLGREAVSRASAAFNEGNMHACMELTDFACGLSQNVRRTMPWVKLNFKYLIGMKLWRKFQAMQDVLAVGR